MDLRVQLNAFNRLLYLHKWHEEASQSSYEMRKQNVGQDLEAYVTFCGEVTLVYVEE